MPRRDLYRRYTDKIGPLLKCSIQFCDHPRQAFTSRGAGWCTTHYQRMREGRDLMAPIKHKRRGDEVCLYPHCGKDATRVPWCEFHYWQAVRRRPMTLRPGVTSPKVGWHDCGLATCATSTRDDMIVCTRHRALARKYGVSQHRLVTLWRDGSCAACGRLDGELHVDHDHSCCPVGNGVKCGECVRGVLCRGCNSALGHLEDDPGRVRALAKYLERQAVRA